MTIFFYALVRAARQKMTESELVVAQQMAQLGEDGNPEAIASLRKMVHEVLLDRR